MAEVERAKRIREDLARWLEHACVNREPANAYNVQQLAAAYESTTTAIALMGGEE